MNNILPLVMAVLAGALLGMFFFGGLWWTVHKGVASDWPALWFIGSLLLRTGVMLMGIYFVSRGHWSRLVACLVGFVVARVTVVKWLARAPVTVQVQLGKEARDASESR